MPGLRGGFRPRRGGFKRKRKEPTPEIEDDEVESSRGSPENAKRVRWDEDTPDTTRNEDDESTVESAPEKVRLSVCRRDTLK